jgi:Ca2+-binding RTX toxin-like protein
MIRIAAGPIEPNGPLVDDWTITTGTKADDTLDGSADKDVIRGFGGDDLIHGGSAKDRIFGGAGDDTIDGGDGQDFINAGAGDDLVIASAGRARGDAGDTVDGGAGFDVISYAQVFTNVAVDLTSGSAVSVELGESHISNFEGVIGGGGNDVLSGQGAVLLMGNDGDDFLTASGGMDVTLDGGAGRDGLQGGPGTYIGGAGGDTITLDSHDLSVGSTLVYNDLDDSSVADNDVIVGLRSSDVIDLSAIDADTTQGGDQAFHLVEGGFTGHAGELQLAYVSSAGQTVLTADVDGDAVADMEIVIDKNHAGFDHFVL